MHLPGRAVYDWLRAANRANAQKSTGPKTVSGKERSRRNALKHGIRSEGDLLPGELDAKVQTAFLKWKDQLRPEGYVETTLVHQAARGSCKLEWLDAQFNAVVTKQVRSAGYRFDARERKGAILDAESLTDNPAETLRLLRDSSAGCDWLLDEWQSLLNALPTGWNDDQTFHALRLLGIDPALSLDEAALPFSESRIQEVMAELVARRASNLAELDAGLRSEAQAASMLPRGKWGSLWPRYQGIALKGYHQAIHDLIKIRRLDDPPRPNDFRRPSADAPNEPNGSPQKPYSSSASDDRAAAFGAAIEQTERENRKLAKTIENLNLQLEMREAQLRATERRAHAAPNKATEKAKPVGLSKTSVKSPRALDQVFKAAAVLMAILLGAWATGKGKMSAMEEKMIQKKANRPIGDPQDAIQDSPLPIQKPSHSLSGGRDDHPHRQTRASSRS